jgi:transcriptional regulator with XRE-family HTH domain
VDRKTSCVAFRRDLGQRLRDARRKKHLKQEAVAADAGIRPATLSGIERGEYAVKLETLRDVARVVEMKLADLLAGLD